MILSLLLAQAQAVPQLAEPFKVEAGGAPIEAVTGHAAPYFYDYDRDGKKDLIVGDFGRGGGRARIFLNVGTDAAPAFGESNFLQAGGSDATVPSS